MIQYTDDWTEEWPTEPGYYWFFGWPGHYRGRDPKLHFVKARTIRNGMAHTTNNRFLYEDDAAGLWREATVPLPGGQRWIEFLDYLGEYDVFD